MKKLNIGVLEDEQPHVAMLMEWLESADYKMFYSDSGERFIQMVKEEKPDMLILDWHLPDCEGIQVLERLRQEAIFAGPVLFATSKDSEQDIVAALTLGADDYLVKPLRKSELIARLAALWRRQPLLKPQLLSLGHIQIDTDNYQVFVSGEEKKLTATEFKLACCLLENEGKLLSREFLLNRVWGIDAEIDTRTVDIHMSKLRRVLKLTPDTGYCIKTIYKHGYRLEKL